MAENLKSKTIGGLFWSSVDNIGLNLIRLVVTIILARILDPADFGLIAILNIFIALADTLMQGGFPSALIKKVRVSEVDYSTVFLFNLVISSILYGIIFIISPFIAVFFKEPQLELIAKTVSLVFVFHSFGVVQQTYLKKKLDFRRIAVVNIAATTGSGILGIVMAVKGYGVWSLVAQIVSRAFLGSTLLMVLGNWKPSVRFSKKSFRENFRFGYKISLAGVINSLVFNAYNVVIGKLFNVEILGFFFQARRLSDIPQTIISNVFKSVSFPVLSEVQENPDRLKKIYLQFLRTVSYLSFPSMMLLAVTGKSLILVFLSDKWTDAAAYFQLLCISGMFIPLVVMTSNIFLVKDRSDIFLKLEIMYKIQMLIFLVVTAFIGVKAMVIGIVIQVAFQLVINMMLVSRFLKISMADHFKQILSILFMTLFAFVTALPWQLIISGAMLLMILQIVTFSGIYMLTSYLFKSAELNEIKILLRNLKNNPGVEN